LTKENPLTEGFYFFFSFLPWLWSSLFANWDILITAADISETDQVQVINKDLHIATLDNKTSDFDRSS
jgi:hypothetical protein